MVIANTFLVRIVQMYSMYVYTCINKFTNFVFPIEIYKMRGGSRVSHNIVHGHLSPTKADAGTKIA